MIYLPALTYVDQHCILAQSYQVSGQDFTGQQKKKKKCSVFVINITWFPVSNIMIIHNYISICNIDYS